MATAAAEKGESHTNLLQPYLLLDHRDPAEPRRRHICLDPLQLDTTLELTAVQGDASLLIDEPSVRASPFFFPATKTTQRRDVADLVQAAVNNGAAEWLSATAQGAYNRIMQACTSVAMKALSKIGCELGVGLKLVEMCQPSSHNILRIIRCIGTEGAADMTEHADHSMISIHIPIHSRSLDQDPAALWWKPSHDKDQQRRPLPSRPLIFGGTMLELLSGGRFVALRHGSDSSLSRDAVVFFCQCNPQTVLSPLVPSIKTHSESDTDLDETDLDEIYLRPLRQAHQSSAENTPITASEFGDKTLNMFMDLLSSPHGTELDELPYLLGANPQELRNHWNLLTQLLHPNSPSPPPNSPCWGKRIRSYQAWLTGVSVDQQRFVEEPWSFPAPPQEMRWCWIAHMLQPSHYAADCNRIFGEVLPHSNLLPIHGVGSDTTLEFDEWWAEHVGGCYPNYPTSLQLPELSLDWSKSLDSSATLFNELDATAAFMTDDAVAVNALLDYRRYVHATEMVRLGHVESKLGVQLAPGPLVDLVWHSHQTSPVHYNTDMMKRPVYLDHEPCGELNPADPKWTDATNDVWSELFPGTLPPSSGDDYEALSSSLIYLDCGRDF